MTETTQQTWQAWIGKQDVCEDQITSAPVRALAATLDRNDISAEHGAPLPPLWHWLYGLPHARQSEIGPDGHPARGGFLPPIDLPRRMWAGSRLSFHRALTIGDRIRRTSTLADIRVKQGRSGMLAFVTVRHEIHASHGLALVEEQDIVYRGSTGGAPPTAPLPETRRLDWQRSVIPDSVLLFRYSALTFNSHRIHYDRPYAMGEEGYPGLVVHGPLIATLLLDAMQRALPNRVVAAFEFRAQRPLFDTAPFSVAGTRTEGGAYALMAFDVNGAAAMDAHATLVPKP